MVNDFYRRFWKPDQSQQHYVTISRLATVFLTLRDPVADMSVIEAEVEVDETDIPFVRLGQPAKIKIDATLVSRLPEDKDACATVNAIVQLARSLGVTLPSSAISPATAAAIAPRRIRATGR